MVPIVTPVIGILFEEMNSIIDILDANNEGEEIEIKCMSADGEAGKLTLVISANAHVQGLEKYDVKISDKSTMIQYTIPA